MFKVFTLITIALLANDIVHSEELRTIKQGDHVEIAAYAYDNGTSPNENPGNVLKQFSTNLRINIWYKLTLIFQETQTIYQVFDDQNQLLESQTIEHRFCQSFNQGMIQDLYFGGVCPAPQDVSVFYDEI